jgi:hypothetical protein
LHGFVGSFGDGNSAALPTAACAFCCAASASCNEAFITNVDDETLAKIIVDLDRLADREFFSYAAWDAGHWSDKRVTPPLHVHQGWSRRLLRPRPVAFPPARAAKTP